MKISHAQRVDLWLRFGLLLALSLGSARCSWLSSALVKPVVSTPLGITLVLVNSDRATHVEAFYAMKTEVTQGLWTQVMGSNPSSLTGCGSDCPVENISWLDAVAFANELSREEGLEMCYLVYPRGRGNQGEFADQPSYSCDGYRLPTDAEWSLAARGGHRSNPFPWGEAPPDCERAVFRDAKAGPGCGAMVAKVCSRPLGNNALGLCDISGNISEWIWDSLPGETAPMSRQTRGGSWDDGPTSQVIETRAVISLDTRSPSVGLRLVRGR